MDNSYLYASDLIAGDHIHTDISTCNIEEPHQGPVVQSIVSLKSSLRGQLVKCFTTL